MQTPDFTGTYELLSSDDTRESRYPLDAKNQGLPESRVSHDTRTIPAFVEWRPVPGYPSYEVSNTGLVRRVTRGPHTRPGKLLKQHGNRYGYLRVDLWHNKKGKTMTVHKVVAEAFIGPRPKDMTINHIDGDKSNNHATNLEYMTRADNIRHAFKIGIHPRGDNGSRRCKLTEGQVREIKRRLPDESNCALGREFGVSDVAIRKIRLGGTWSHVA